MKNIASHMSPLFTAGGITDLETPSDTEIVPPSSNVTEDLRLDEEIGSETNFEGIVGRSSTPLDGLGFDLEMPQFQHQP